MKVWILIFVCMFAMPLLVAILYFRMRKGQILKIRQDYVKNARYFGQSFSSLVEKALPEMKNGMIMLSRQEKVLETDVNQEFVQPDLISEKQSFFAVYSPESYIFFYKQRIFFTVDFFLEM